MACSARHFEVSTPFTSSHTGKLTSAAPPAISRGYIDAANGGHKKVSHAALPAIFAYVFPTTHAVALLNGVWDGSGWSAHLMNVGALFVLFAVYTAVSTRVFRWE